MASISLNEVQHVARLARLELTEAECSTFAEQLSQILTYVDQLQHVSTDDMPVTPGLGNRTVLREDIPREGVSVEVALANAPESHEGFFIVPKILGK